MSPHCGGEFRLHTQTRQSLLPNLSETIGQHLLIITLAMAVRPFLTLLHACFVLAICYNPDASIATQDVPCTNGTFSTCCGQGYACLSNMVCMRTSAAPSVRAEYPFLRGSCTDPMYKSASCPSFCISQPDNDRDQAQAMLKCSDAPGDHYICNNKVSDCNDPSVVIAFQGEHY